MLFCFSKGFCQKKSHLKTQNNSVSVSFQLKDTNISSYIHIYSFIYREREFFFKDKLIPRAARHCSFYHTLLRSKQRICWGLFSTVGKFKTEYVRLTQNKLVSMSIIVKEHVNSVTHWCVSNGSWATMEVCDTEKEHVRIWIHRQYLLVEFIYCFVLGVCWK